MNWREEEGTLKSHVKASNESAVVVLLLRRKEQRFFSASQYEPAGIALDQISLYHKVRSCSSAERYQRLAVRLASKVISHTPDLC